MRRAMALALTLAPVSAGACQGSANEAKDRQARVAPPSTEQLPVPLEPSTGDAPARDPLSYLPPDTRLVGQLDLRALLDKVPPDGKPDSVGCAGHDCGLARDGK